MQTTAPDTLEALRDDAGRVLPEAARDLVKVYGVSGTVHSGGKVVKPWDRFTWRDWCYQAEEMKLDPQVMQAATVRMAAPLGGVPRLELPQLTDPAERELSKRIAAFVSENLGLDGQPGTLQSPLSEYLAESMWFLHYGAYVMEVRADYHPRTGQLVPVQLEGRAPISIDRWGDFDHLGPMTQLAQGDLPRRPEPIPGRRLMVWTRGKVGTDWTGLGLARSAWSAWARRKRLQDIRQVGCEQRGSLPPQVMQDPQVIASSGLEESKITTLVNDQVQNLVRYQSGAQAALASVKGVTEVLWSGADNFDPAKILAAEDAEVNEIHAAYGTNYLRFGVSGNAGNRSLGEVHSDMLRRFAIEDAEQLCAPFNGAWRDGGGLIGAMVEWNFGRVDPRILPRLYMAGLETDRLADQMAMLSALTGSWLTPSKLDEPVVREKLGLPQLPDGQLLGDADRLLAAMGPAALPGAALLARMNRTQGVNRG